MEKVSLLSQHKHTDRQRGKSAATSAEKAGRLTHTIMNQLTVINLSCAKLRRRPGPDSFAQEESAIQIIESAVEKIAMQVEALRFRLEQISRAQAKIRSGQPQKRPGSKTQLSFISPLGVEKP